MRTFRVAAATLVALLGCTKQETTNGHTTFTLESGVTLLSLSECASFEGGQKASLQKLDARYVVTALTPLNCEASLSAPYLQEAGGHKATLVLPKADSAKSFSTGCECPRSIKISITGRLESGDTLYVLNDDHVLGHFTVP